jgi:hypothetical protein
VQVQAGWWGLGRRQDLGAGQQQLLASAPFSMQPSSLPALLITFSPLQTPLPMPLKMQPMPFAMSLTPLSQQVERQQQLSM